MVEQREMLTRASLKSVLAAASADPLNSADPEVHAMAWATIHP
jgi:hypothetical protein